MREERVMSNIDLTRIEKFLKRAEADPSVAEKEITLEVEWVNRKGIPQMRCYVSSGSSLGALLEAELPSDLGGKSIRPTPFQYFLYGLATSYLSIFMILASQKGISFDKVSLSLKTRMNYLRFLKLEEEGAPYEITLRIVIESEAADEELYEIMENAKKLCPAFSPINVKVFLERENVNQ